MTKKCGDHKSDVRIAKSDKKNSKYMVEEKFGSQRYYFGSIELARKYLSLNYLYDFKFTVDIGKMVVCKTQPRPAAKAAPKVHVPKGTAKPAKATKLSPAMPWPFPSPTNPTLPNLSIVNGVSIEFENGITLEYVHPTLIRITRN